MIIFQTINRVFSAEIILKINYHVTLNGDAYKFLNMVVVFCFLALNGVVSTASIRFAPGRGVLGVVLLGALVLLIS